ncbi:MAG: hypothetical protein R3E82_00195 [Pseudomonadales bacterium]|nr:hypothetical protein [Pseudomonadales bacterium]
MSNSGSHRQMLVRCGISNRSGAPGVRFVEHSLFRLWQYMMANKHNILVENAELCLWLPEIEWRSQSALFQRAGATHAVHRISFAIYDPATGHCDTLQRFTPAADSAQLQQLLLERIPADRRATGDFTMQLEEGQAIVRDGLADLITLGYTLTDSGLVPG